MREENASGEQEPPAVQRAGPRQAREPPGRLTEDERQAMVPESLMPRYAFLAQTPLAYDDITAHLRANRTVGVPYTEADIANARADLHARADPQADTAALLKR
jgi:cytochrome c oxidase cbb3-type subunit 2